MLVNCRPFSQQPPHQWGVSVYGVMLNHQPAWDAMAPAMSQAPHRSAPQAPVLYLKPRNTHTGDGPIAVPTGQAELELGACLALVMGRTTRGVEPSEALSHVSGLLTVADVRIPHDSLYRPSVRFIAHDGFCPMAARVTPLAEAGNPDDLAVTVWVDGQAVHHTTTGNRRRTAAQLIADVSAFMTLNPGDMLLMGVSHGAPRVRAGQHSHIEIQGLTPLTNQWIPAGDLA